MWWIIISVIALVVLVIEAVLSGMMVLVMLNGYMSIPDAMVNIYLACNCGLVPVLSLLAGWGAKKLSEVTPMPLWLGGVILTVVALIVLPIVLFVLAFVLLGAFGLLK